MVVRHYRSDSWNVIHNVAAFRPSGLIIFHASTLCYLPAVYEICRSDPSSITSSSQQYARHLTWSSNTFPFAHQIASTSLATYWPYESFQIVPAEVITLQTPIANDVQMQISYQV